MTSNAFPLLHGNRLHSLHPGLYQQLTTSPSPSSAGVQRAEAKLRLPPCPGYHWQKMGFSPIGILNCKPDNYHCSAAMEQMRFSTLTSSLFLYHHRQLTTELDSKGFTMVHHWG